MKIIAPKINKWNDIRTKIVDYARINPKQAHEDIRQLTRTHQSRSCAERSSGALNYGHGRS